MEFNLPQNYGDNKIVLMVRDPRTVFSYWEINKEVEDTVREKIRTKGLTSSASLLRVYDVTETSPDNNPAMISDFELEDLVNSWYIHGDPGRKWMVEIGLICTNGEFFCLARSNIVETPIDHMSEVYDEEWKELYDKMFAASGGYDTGSSSLELRELMERHLRKWLSSGGFSSGMSGSANVITGRK